MRMFDLGLKKACWMFFFAPFSPVECCRYGGINRKEKHAAMFDLHKKTIVFFLFLAPLWPRVGHANLAFPTRVDRAISQVALHIAPPNL